ncbi:MAG TPA: hypothetical protein DDZ44_02650 [Syntrophomonas wolfei]|jgi:hypothetical protein|uniref:Uncharacterized protein n=1 Tax=Syntrophomonas wolfei TaxID=863 RepID=A0A354YTY0_9FIRM|nr:hypothetical protein [Syntrophomonas wolfei]
MRLPNYWLTRVWENKDKTLAHPLVREALNSIVWPGFILLFKSFWNCGIILCMEFCNKPVEL